MTLTLKWEQILGLIFNLQEGICIAKTHFMHASIFTMRNSWKSDVKGKLPKGTSWGHLGMSRLSVVPKSCCTFFY